MIQILHVDQRHASLDSRSPIEKIAPQHLFSYKQAEKNDEMNRADTRAFTSNFPKVQETITYPLSKAALAQSIKQQNPQDMPTGSKQCVPIRPGGQYLPQERLRFHGPYLIKRMKETEYRASGSKLFKEIQAKGYRGAFKSVQNFISTIRQSQRSPEEGLAFHRETLIKRMKETGHHASGSSLCKEIRAKGYRGSASTVRLFLSKIRRNQHFAEGCLAFHQDYLIKRMTETEYRASGSELFKEIQAKGYRGSTSALRHLLSKIRRNRCPPERCLTFHQGYLKKRMKETQYRASGPELFKEIQTKGYQGSASAVRHFLSKIRRNQCLPPERCLTFHQGYLMKRMKETQYRASGSKLFKEIQAKGYRGSASTVQHFLSKIRQNGRLPEASLTFHQDYLSEKIEGENESRHFSTLELFEDIRAKGYQGSISNLRKQLAVLRKETALKNTRAEGYLGSIKTVHNFLMTPHPTKRSPKGMLKLS